MRSFDASSAHQGLWLAEDISPDTLNHALTLWDVEGALDPAVMEAAFLHVMEEAEVLRVTFTPADPDPGTPDPGGNTGGGDGGGERRLRMVPRDLGPWRPFLLDVAAEPDPEQAARTALADIVRPPFDLTRDLLFRLGTVKLAADRFLIVIAYHHLISDGFGTGGLLSRRLAEVYTALARGQRIPDLPHPWDAESYAAGATDYRASEAFTEDTAFWRGYLADAPAPAQVPRVDLAGPQRAALAEPAGPADRWGELTEPIGMVSRTLTVPRAEADTWRRTAQTMGVWMSTMLTAAAAAFFRHRCDRGEFLLSLAVGNRVGPASRTPGLAVNVVPVRVKVPLEASFTDLADALVDETYEIFDHTACHYSRIQRAAGTAPGNRGGFGAVMNVVDFVEQLDFAGHRARYLGGTTGAFNELSIGVYNDGTDDSDLFIRLDAPAALYSRAQLRFIGTELIAHIRAAVAAPDRPVGALDVLAGAERDRLLPAPPTAARTAPQEGHSVPELFARQAARTPAAVALADGDREITYRELEERSTALARTLRRRHRVRPETVVAVALPRCADLAVALLAVAKAGGAYLTADPAAGADRLRTLTGDTGAALLLTDPATAAALAPALDIPALPLPDPDAAQDGDGDGAEDAAARDAAEPAAGAPAPPHPDSLLAVAYHGGPDGAGEPAAVTHRNLRHFASDRQCRETGRGTVLWHGPPAGRTLAFELWVPLLNGGRVVLAPADGPDLGVLERTPAADGGCAVRLDADRFMEIAAERPGALAGLREVWTGGDRVPAAALRRVRQACPDLTLVHGHGPAGTAGFAAAHRLEPHTPRTPESPEAPEAPEAPEGLEGPEGLESPDGPDAPAGVLGRPLDHVTCYVLGPGLSPVPAGVTGDLYVAGPGVARGCHGRPGATAQRFVPCPTGPPGGLMYRTGERARWGTDGRLRYVGGPGTRAEIRGVRIELAGVEEVLAGHPAVARTVVTAGADAAGQRRLAAYVVPVPGQTVTEEELRRFAARRLPEPMVPSVFTVLERLPLTGSGRVDRAALPEPGLDGGRYRAPRNETERVLAAAFADVLGVERVGIDEDFFDLGGNSLRAIRLVGLIRAELKQEVSIRRLFAARTVIGLSDMWKDLGRSSRPSLRRRTKDGAVL